MKARLRLGLLVTVAVTAMAFASSALGQNYVVLYKSQAVPADAAQTIAKAGGTLVYSYGQIGVAIASSDSASFRANLLKDNKIENASGTAGIRHPAHRQRRLVARCERASWRRPAERPGHRRRLTVAASVGHAADLHARGARDHGRQSGRARRRHRHRDRLHPSRPASRTSTSRTASTARAARPSRGSRRRTTTATGPHTAVVVVRGDRTRDGRAADAVDAVPRCRRWAASQDGCSRARVDVAYEHGGAGAR